MLFCISQKTWHISAWYAVYPEKKNLKKNGQVEDKRGGRPKEKTKQTPFTAGEHHLEVISISSETVPYACQEAIVMERKQGEKAEACQITQELGSKLVATGLMKG